MNRSLYVKILIPLTMGIALIVGACNGRRTSPVSESGVTIYVSTDRVFSEPVLRGPTNHVGFDNARGQRSSEDKLVADSFIRLTQVTKGFGNGIVVDHVSLDVEDGEVVALLGPSGSGKTTLLRLIAGLESPDEGEVWIAGRRVAVGGQNLLPPRVRGIGFVFQDLALLPHLTVEGSLDFVLASARMKRPDRSERIDEVLRLVHALPFAKRYPNQLSGGEQQRVAIARAVVARPQVLLLDEPMSSLDSELKTALSQELATLQRVLRITTVYVTHNREEASALAHRVVSMRGGRVEEVRESREAVGTGEHPL